MELDFPSKQTIRRVYEALFNYLGVAVGDGRGASFTFNVFDFAARFRFFVPTALQSIKILQQNGYMVLTDETDNPPRIRFIVQRDELYRIRVDRRELDHFITVLLRRYSGLFSDFVPIAEDELAHLTGYTAGQVRELLKKLWQLHIVKYIPGNRSPMLILSEERLPADDVRISPESYTLRKEAAEKRLGAMLRYLNGDECRSIAIRPLLRRAGTLSLRHLRPMPGATQKRPRLAAERSRTTYSGTRRKPADRCQGAGLEPRRRCLDHSRHGDLPARQRRNYRAGGWETPD